MSILAFLALLIGAILVFLIIYFCFVWILSLPFYFLGFIFKLLFFPVTLINQYIYPVWTLPYLALSAWLFFLFAHLFLINTKSIASLKPVKKSTSKK